MPHRTIDDVLSRLGQGRLPMLPAPAYTGAKELPGVNVGLAVESMKRHMTDEGWCIFAGLEHAGYRLAGLHLPWGETDVRRILSPSFQPRCGSCEAMQPWGQVRTVVVQDAREWDVKPNDFREPAARFINVDALKSRPDIFTLTILKDSHQRPEYHRDSAMEMGAHGWIVYYHPRIVTHLASYVRPQHLIRTYHSVDATLIPDPLPGGDVRRGALLSGAVSSAYPLREQLVRGLSALPETTHMKHPGYHRNGCATPAFLRELVKYKVSICTSSIYGYSLRKLIESTACGCIVLTDLPEDEVMPEIDGNLVRIGSDFMPRRVGKILSELYASYDFEKQRDYAKRAQAFYDYRIVGRRLAADIETLRRNYVNP